MLRTLWIQNPAHIEQCVLQEANFFCTRPSSRSYVRNWHKQELFWNQEIFALCKLLSHYSINWVSTSPVEVFFQETPAKNRTLALRQNEYCPQVSRWLGWEIHLEFRGIPGLIQFWTFWNPEFSSKFYFSNRKMCSRQFKHVSSNLESSPAINFSDFMNWKTFPPSHFFWPSKKESSGISQPVVLRMLNCVDGGIIPGKAILITNI